MLREFDAAAVPREFRRTSQIRRRKWTLMVGEEGGVGDGVVVDGWVIFLGLRGGGRAWQPMKWREESIRYV